MRFIKTFLVIIILCVSSVRLEASDDIKFSITPVLPDNQIDQNIPYHFLRVEPNATQTLVVDVVSLVDEPVRVGTTVNLALTNSNGIIVYDGESDGVPSKSLVHNIETIAVVKTPEIVLPGRATVPVEIELNLPSDPFSGVLLGGITFREIRNDGTSGLAHDYVYNSGLALTMEDVDAMPKSNLMDVVGNRTEVVNGRKITVLEIENPEPGILNGLQLSMSVTNKSGKEVLKSEKERVSLSPNTVMSYFLDWNARDVEAGDYIAHIDAQTASNQWRFDYPFTIAKEVAHDVNEASPVKVVLPPWAMKTILSVGVLTLAVTGILVNRTIQRRKEDKRL